MHRRRFLALSAMSALPVTPALALPEPGADTADTAAAQHQVTLLFAGDLMQHDGQIKAARTADGGYDYSDVFARVAPEIKRHDIAVANLEVTLAGPPYKGYPNFSAPDEYMHAAVDAGFNVLLTANTHCCDTRGKGLRRTIEQMDARRVQHLGTYLNLEERQRKYPLIIECNNIRIALLNFTYGTNGMPIPAPFVVNLEDSRQIAKDIADAQASGADVIIAFPHWGIEYALLPSAEQRKRAAWLLEKGVHHIIGSHPHVVQPFEVTTDENGEPHLTVFSLGNYVSNMTRPNTDGGAMVTMTLTKKDGKTTMSDCGYSLFWVSRPATSKQKNFRIYPASWPTGEMNDAERSLRERYLASTRELLEKHNQGIKETLAHTPDTAASPQT
ncbi:MAG: CapA family protein [Ottowia sp.]|nr:CapA family protein [Ottowia sp.]